MKRNIIVALDGMDEARALELAAALGERVWGFKVNDLLIQSGLGVVRKLKKFGNVFADPKLHDIPNTVANGVKELAAAGADLITVHASGGSEMLKAAAKAAQNSKILAVTVLTSFNDAAAKEVFGQDTRSTVTRFARLASASGVHGLVSSPQELELLADLTDLLKVTPGVRPASYAKSDDQARTMTPREAFEKGATHLVIGRPITGEKDPIGAMDKIEAEL